WARLQEVSRLVGSVPTALVAPLMRYRHERRAPPRPLDLNRVAGRVVERVRPEGAAVRVELAPDLPPVMGTPAGLGRAVRLLLNNALAVTPAGRGPVTL